jgi:hypothetical protein
MLHPDVADDRLILLANVDPPAVLLEPRGHRVSFTIVTMNFGEIMYRQFFHGDTMLSSTLMMHMLCIRCT